MKAVKIFLYILFAFTLYCCVPEEVILHGNIHGNVRDADLKQPLDSAIVTLKQSQTTRGIDTTDITGTFQFKNLSPDDYDIIASKHLFETEEQSVSVEEANITEISLSLNGAPYPEFSKTWVDFGFESTEGSFIVSNAGRGELQYHLTLNQDWITVEPQNGKITTGADTIKVTIDRTNLSDLIYEEEIYFTYHISGEPIQENIDIFLNGIVDKDGNCYSIVTIGTQTWMQESLNTGKQISVTDLPSDNQIVEKYCYGDDAANCETYGGMYAWTEMMDYFPIDTGMIGSTQGICLDGWHIPTLKELEVLLEYLGGWEVAGGRMKASSPLWEDGNNPGAKDSGFEALPGGLNAGGGSNSGTGIGKTVNYWVSDFYNYQVSSERESLHVYESANRTFDMKMYLRCIKDPE